MTVPQASMAGRSPQLGRLSGGNVGTAERIGSAAAGGLLALLGLRLRGPGGITLALLGGYGLARGVGRHCAVYRVLRRNSAATGAGPNAVIKHGEGIKIERAVTVARPAAELYCFWRNVENLPRFMRRLRSVQALDPQRSHWIAAGPAGRAVVWDAEVYNERENELLAWRLTGGDVVNAGAVRFLPAPGGRSTEVHVSLEYHPPAGEIGATIARLFGDEPGQAVAEELRRFKQMMEAGEVALVAGQPAGR
jgi:uncharacterized membrane protein